jgi:hypothetical protein
MAMRPPGQVVRDLAIGDANDINDVDLESG